MLPTIIIIIITTATTSSSSITTTTPVDLELLPLVRMKHISNNHYHLFFVIGVSNYIEHEAIDTAEGMAFPSSVVIPYKKDDKNILWLLATNYVYSIRSRSNGSRITHQSRRSQP
jgi:hypothetical protein